MALSPLPTANRVAVQDEFDEEDNPWKGFFVGINVGAYFASKKTANFYNGTCAVSLLSDPNDIRCYSIYERLGMDGNIAFQRDYNYITDYYQVTGMELNYDSYPLNMGYTPSMLVGLQLKYLFNKDASIIFNSNSIRLKAVDQFTIRFIGGGQQQNAQTDTRLFQVVGKEDRYNLNLGYRQGFESNDVINTYLQFGASMLATRMKSNEIMVAERTYSLYVGASNPNQLVAFRPRTDVGFGYYASAGLEFFLKDQYTFDISLNYSRDQVILITYKERTGNFFFQMSFNI